MSSYDVTVMFICEHSDKKWKNSLETLAVLLIFSIKLEISGGGPRGHTSK